MTSIRRKNIKGQVSCIFASFLAKKTALAIVCMFLPLILRQVFFTTARTSDMTTSPAAAARLSTTVGLERSESTQNLRPATKPSQKGALGIKKESSLEHLKNAGLNVSTIDEEVLGKISDWKKIKSILGHESPHILGLETCSIFRSLVGNGNERYIGVSGMFNSGTNVLARLLEDNCDLPVPESNENPEDETDDEDAEEGILWQVPWGKHSPAWQRDLRRAPEYEDYNNTRVLAAVMVRNPFEIMESMCRNSYSVHFPEDVESACPHLVHPGTGELLPVEVGLRKPRLKFKSIVHYWNEWYRGYSNDFPHPRLIIRLEDLTVFPKETIKTICECAGGAIVEDNQFKFIHSSAKKGMGHGDESEKNGLVEAWTRLGREIDYPIKDYEATLQYLDRELMEVFKYNPPPLKQT